MSSTIYPNVVTGYTDPATEEFVEHGPPGVGETNGASTIYPNVVTGYTDLATGEFIEHGPTDILDVVIGTVTSGPVAEVTNTGTGSEPILNFVLPEGPQGEVGPVGPSFEITGSVATVEDLPATGTQGENYLVEEDGKLYFWDTVTNTWEARAQLVGPKGDAATIAIGTTITDLPNTVATVVNVGTIHDAILNFTIPRGHAIIPEINTLGGSGTMPLLTPFYTEVLTVEGIVRGLPPPSLANKGYVVNIKNVSTGQVGVSGNIEGGTISTLIINNNLSARFQSNGLTWYTI